MLFARAILISSGFFVPYRIVVSSVRIVKNYVSSCIFVLQNLFQVSWLRVWYMSISVYLYVRKYIHTYVPEWPYSKICKRMYYCGRLLWLQSALWSMVMSRVLKTAPLSGPLSKAFRWPLLNTSLLRVGWSWTLFRSTVRWSTLTASFCDIILRLILGEWHALRKFLWWSSAHFDAVCTFHWVLLVRFYLLRCISSGQSSIDCTRVTTVKCFASICLLDSSNHML